ncbi:hypothetical protein Syun_016389 [Stephania yunnanensis]|uniref:Uncharacterized protein n=1 Tax=Stephania yunnanensis TaxID=152371 RepID=A0AAP0J7C6_9MAGN
MSSWWAETETIEVYTKNTKNRESETGFASSSSSSLREEAEEGKPNSGEAKPGKKLAERLASVMDAIHDRNLLRSRPNAVRLVFRYNLIVPFGRQMFGLNWEKELDRLKKQE